MYYIVSCPNFARLAAFLFSYTSSKRERTARYSSRLRTITKLRYDRPRSQHTRTRDATIVSPSDSTNARLSCWVIGNNRPALQTKA